MDLALKPEYEAFRADVLALLEGSRAAAPTAEDRGMKHPKRLAWQKWLIENGLAARTIPESYGGYGAEPDILKSRIIAEAFAATGLPRPIANQGVSMLVATLLELGTEAQKQAFIPPTLRGEMIWCQGYSEPGSGSDLASLKTKAVIDGDDYVINGQKTFITNGQTANMIIVVTKTNPEEGASGTSLIVVETDEVEGFSRGRNLKKMGHKAQDTSELFFDDVRVPAENRLGNEEGQGFIQLMEQLPQERHIIGVQGIAAIERALDLTLDYTRERKAFGRPIFNFQNTQFKLAELKAKATMARVFVDYCTEQLLAGTLDPATGSMSKLLLSDLECEVMDECLQLFGGYGYMDEYPISRMYTDARVQRIYGGTNEIMKLLIARTM